jgi:hypothetical protein
MVQSGSGASFALEAFESLMVAGNVVGQEFQGHVATESQIFGFIDDTHPTAA